MFGAIKKFLNKNTYKSSIEGLSDIEAEALSIANSPIDLEYPDEESLQMSLKLKYPKEYTLVKAYDEYRGGKALSFNSFQHLDSCRKVAPVLFSSPTIKSFQKDWLLWEERSSESIFLKNKELPGLVKEFIENELSFDTRLLIDGMPPMCKLLLTIATLRSLGKVEENQIRDIINNCVQELAIDDLRRLGVPGDVLRNSLPDYVEVTLKRVFNLDEG